MTIAKAGDEALIGETLGHYRIVRKIGAGGMGVVYLAHDEHLEREVAIKVLPLGTLADESSRRRFRNEALVLSRLNHPNIATIFDFDTQQGRDFLVMEYIPGVTLSDKLAETSLPEKQTVTLGTQLADGLCAAHEHSVIHRDLKPSNLRIATDDRLKILDFGLAKLRLGAAASPATETISEPHAAAGTLPYMAPEQLLGREVDARTDIHAAGAVLYEMATGQRAFGKVDQGALVTAILHSSPIPPTTLNPGLSPELDRIISKCLEKDQERRYQSAKELCIDLKRLGTPSDAAQIEKPAAPEKQQINASKTTTSRLVRSVVLIPLLMLTVALSYVAGSAIYHNRKAQWAREVALPKALQFTAKDDWVSAYALAVEAEKYIPRDPQLNDVISDVAILLSVTTNPPGANVLLKPYGSASDFSESIGSTPIQAHRISRGFKEYKIEKPGYDPVTGFTGWDLRLPPRAGRPIQLERTLLPAGTTPAEMVKVDAENYTPAMLLLPPLPQVQLNEFLIDRFEVTNSQYQAFVEARGYKEQKYWKQEFLENGKHLSWDEAIAHFTDKTGTNGPATWELAHFPEGQGEFPVSGISWYEAAAYAEFVGKTLPTIYHWSRAAGIHDSYVARMIINSNFSASGSAPVGKFRGISPFGAFDMAGNVREWISNGGSGGKYLLGGSWGTPEYLFYNAGEVLSPFDRSITNGFRCMKLLGNSALPPPTVTDIPASPPPSRLLSAKPVSDDVFKLYAAYYSYDKGPLNAVAESIDNSSPYYTRERVTFNAAYGKERVIAYIYLPKNSNPPYQSVMIFPGSSALRLGSIDAYALKAEMFTRSGRAVVFPVYKGTFERERVDTSTPALKRDFTIMLYRDLARSLDYLNTRIDFDHRKVGYYGVSWGATIAPIIGALENRIRVFVLEGGGLIDESLPEIAPINFAPRDHAPTVIFNGRYDIIFPVETSAKPLLQRLGTPESDKALILFDVGHVPPLDSKLEKLILEWLDRYLGRVR